jgi:ribosomal protein L11 methyltransferase
MTPQPSRGPAPCPDLHIYYLSGRPSPEPEPDAHFIGNWQEEDFAFLFFTRPAPRAVARLLAAQPHLTLLDKYHMTYEQWQGGPLRPLRAGRFRVSPPWDPASPEDPAIDIRLDPGVVFGNGMHPTTRHCLEAIDQVFDAGPVASAVDLGTGTGLLALAAAKRGCPRTLAVDSNRLAARTAWANVRRNGLDHRVLVVQGRAEDWIDGPGALLIANIHHEVMQRLIGAEGFAAKQWFVLSGLLRHQAEQTADRLAGKPVRIVRRWEHDGVWHTFLGKAR